MSEVPAGIRIDVPEEYGSAYTTNGERQWVERRQRIGKSLAKKLEGLAEAFSDDNKAAKEAYKILATMFTDWTLCDDEGPLPKPWGSPEAFDALLECDLDLSLWVLGLIHQPISQLLAPSKN